MKYEIQSVGPRKVGHRIMQGKFGRQLWFVPKGSEIGYSLYDPAREARVIDLEPWAGTVLVTQEPNG